MTRAPSTDVSGTYISPQQQTQIERGICSLLEYGPHHIKILEVVLGQVEADGFSKKLPTAPGSLQQTKRCVRPCSMKARHRLGLYR